MKFLITLSQDEGNRPQTRLEDLQGLKPVFKDGQRIKVAGRGAPGTNGATALSFWVDGINVGSATTTAALSGPVTVIGAQPTASSFTVGNPSAGATDFFAGGIKQVSIHARTIGYAAVCRQAIARTEPLERSPAVRWETRSSRCPRACGDPTRTSSS